MPTRPCIIGQHVWVKHCLKGKGRTEKCNDSSTQWLCTETCKNILMNVSRQILSSGVGCSGRGRKQRQPRRSAHSRAAGGRQAWWGPEPIEFGIWGAARQQATGHSCARRIHWVAHGSQAEPHASHGAKPKATRGADPDLHTQTARAEFHLRHNC